MRLGETRKRAEKRAAEAMYLVFLSMSDEYTEPVAIWKWLCQSADQGYEKAQFEMACAGTVFNNRGLQGKGFLFFLYEDDQQPGNWRR